MKRDPAETLASARTDSLVESLVAFEQYSEGCENRNEDDARIHRMLYEASARSREVMEIALEELLVFEGIDV